MRVQADLFSGRPNPEWALRIEESAELARRLGELAPGAAPTRPDGNGLGYRGLLVTETERWIAGCEEVRVHRGHVTVHCAAGERAYLDPGRALERWLVDSAAGRVDAHVLQVLRAELEV